MRRLRILLLVVLALGFFSPCAVAEDEAEEAKDYRSGSIRLGAFWVGQIDNTIVARSESFPVGLFIDLSRDFALSDSITVPRGMFGYRFSRRHQVNIGYFQISRDNQVVLERTIEIGESVFPIGARVDFSYDTRVYKAAYTWLFYDSDKVVLGASFGLNYRGFRRPFDRRRRRRTHRRDRDQGNDGNDRAPSRARTQTGLSGDSEAQPRRRR